VDQPRAIVVSGGQAAPPGSLAGPWPLAQEWILPRGACSTVAASLLLLLAITWLCGAEPAGILPAAGAGKALLLARQASLGGGRPQPGCWPATWAGKGTRVLRLES